MSVNATGPHIRISPNHPGRRCHRIEVDGHDILDGLEAEGRPRLWMPEATRDALIALGWTAPADEVEEGGS
jgi:hypothetical protein